MRRDTLDTIRQVYRFLDLPDFTQNDSDPHNVGDYQPMSPLTRQRIEEWFAPHQEALGKLLDSIGAPALPGSGKR